MYLKCCKTLETTLSIKLNNSPASLVLLIHPASSFFINIILRFCLSNTHIYIAENSNRYSETSISRTSCIADTSQWLKIFGEQKLNSHISKPFYSGQLCIADTKMKVLTWKNLYIGDRAKKRKGIK